MPEKDCRGGETFESRGLEAPFGKAVVGLVRQAMGCPSVWVFAKPPNMRKLAGAGGTPNHRLLWRVWYWGWAQRAGDAGERKESKELLVDFLGRQFGKMPTGPAEGQLWGETLTTSHYQLWLLGTAGLRYLARFHDDRDLLDLTGKWFRRELYCWNLLERDGHVFSPGSRTSINYTDVRTVARSLLMGVPAPSRVGSTRPIPGRPNEPEGPFWTSTYNVGCWIVRASIREGDDLGGAAGPEHATEETLLRNSLFCHTKPGGDVRFLFPYFTKASAALFWTARLGDRWVNSPYHPGQINNRPNPYPPPDFSGARVAVIPGAQDPAEMTRAFAAGEPWEGDVQPLDESSNDGDDDEFPDDDLGCEYEPES